MNSHRQKPLTPWLLIILFIIISVGSIILGYLYYKSQKQQLLKDKSLELSAIADLKAKQINQWRKERLGDALFLGQNSALTERFSEYLNDPENLILRREVAENLRELTINTDYRNALLLDSTGNICVAFPAQDKIMGDYFKSILPDLLQNRRAVLTDFHETDNLNFIHSDLIIPFSDPAGQDSSITGLLALRIDPRDYFYPLVQTWPVPTRTAEALLIKQESDKILYLTELRFKRSSELLLRRSLSEENLPAAMAIRGIESAATGTDYRGTSVVAAMKKVPGSPWYLITKIDHSEVFSILDKQMTLIIIIIILFILTTGLLLGIIEWNENVRFYREKYEAELDRLALRRHFDYILKYANDIIFLTDRNLMIIEANDRAMEVYQYKRDELIGRNISAILDKDSMKKMNEIKKNLDQVGYATYELDHVRRDGTKIPVEISSRKVDIEGVKYYQSICRDITERKSAEETLRESEDRFRKIFEESPLSIVMTGKDLGIIRANSAFCKMIGYNEEELKLLTFRDFTHPDYISGDELSLMRLMAEEIPLYHSEKQFIRKDHSFIWGSTTISVIRNNNEEVQYFLAMIEDITLRKQAENELEKSFSLIKTTLESTADGILVVDKNEKIIQYNQKFLEMWRIPHEIVRSGDDIKVINFVMDQLSDPDEFVNKIRQLYSEEETTTSDLLVFNDGRIFERYSQPQKINGKSVGRVWSFRDITERKKAEAELIAAKEKAEESDRLKTAFLHNISHEIRTPMNAIIGFSALLSEPDVSESDRNQFIDIIFQSGSQLLSIINDIVDIANIESGQVKINIKEMNLNLALKNLNEQFSYKEQPEGVTINLKTGLPDDKSIILTDSTKLIQVLSNLISNATKFTKEGRIDFGYDLDNGYMEFFVKDTGIGIPPEHHEKIFNRFFQVENFVSKKFSGTGLGLSICKAYVELLGGKIWLDSHPGEGTSFYFTIPYHIPSGT